MKKPTIIDSRLIFLKACNEIAHQLEGFKAIEKGQRLKKIATDNDIFFEIYFQSSFLNSTNHIVLIPHISIYSKALKKWQIAQTKNPYCNGIIYTNSLCYLIPSNQWRDWNIAGPILYKKSVQEIIENIITYILPIFEIFESKPTAISYLTKNGTRFHKWNDFSLVPLDFLICFAQKKETTKFLHSFMAHCEYKEKIYLLYNDLTKDSHINLLASEFIGADKIKLAFVNGISVYPNES